MKKEVCTNLAIFEKAAQALEKSDPIMIHLINSALSGSAELRNPTLAEPTSFVRNIYRSIVSQQLSVKAAAKIWERFMDLTQDPHNPEQILAHTVEEYRAIGLSRPKANYILGIANNIYKEEVVIDHLNELSNEDVITELVKLKGVGRWTAEMFLMFSLARPDVFSVGDLGLRNAITRHYGIPATDLFAIEELSKSWSPYRTACSLVLWHSLDNIPN